MKITLDFEMSDFEYWSDDNYEHDDNHMNRLLDAIVERAAAYVIDNWDIGQHDLHQAIADTVNNAKQKIYNQLRNEITDDGYKTLKEEITRTIIDDISNKYNRSTDYKTIKKELGIVSDSEISTGMRKIISEIVKSEVKKIIKL